MHKQPLSHVLWLGGATDAGKTSVATVLAERYGLQLYSFDEHAEELWENHFSQQPSSHGYQMMALRSDERWVLPSPAALARQSIEIATECFPVVIERLLALPPEPLIIAEGFEFLPELVEAVLPDRRQAIWLGSTETFQRTAFVQRGKADAHKNKSDPERAAQNHFNRDRLLAQHIAEEALRRGLTYLEVDGSLPLLDVVSLVERQFEPFLPKVQTR